MKILDLVLKKQWYDMIKSGVKHEEYREIKPYWTKRLIDKDGTFKKFTHVKFRCGYTNRFIIYRIVSIKKGYGNTDWGVKEGEIYYVIKLENKSLKQEFNEVFEEVIKQDVAKYYVDGKIDSVKLQELFVKRIMKLFEDTTMDFEFNKDTNNIVLRGKDEHTKNLIKLIAEHE